MAGRKKSLTGKVVGDKMEKTLTVVVESTARHRLYRKILRRSKRYLVHDELEAKPGDVVRITETRPLSRHKRWRVAEIMKRGEVPEIAPREIDSEYLTLTREREELPQRAAKPTAEPATAEAGEGAPAAEPATPEAGAATTEAAPAGEASVTEDAAPAEAVVTGEASVTEEAAPAEAVVTGEASVTEEAATATDEPGASEEAPAGEAESIESDADEAKAETEQPEADKTDNGAEERSET